MQADDCLGDPKCTPREISAKVGKEDIAQVLQYSLAHFGTTDQVSGSGHISCSVGASGQLPVYWYLRQARKPSDPKTNP